MKREAEKGESCGQENAQSLVDDIKSVAHAGSGRLPGVKVFGFEMKA